MPEVQLSQGTIRYREVGEGPVLVFVHGVIVDGGLWGEVVERLRSDYRCIVPDWPLGAHELPLHEDADRTPPGIARLIAEFLEALDLEDVTLVGNDTGGALCQIVVTRHPERIGRLVLTPCDAFENFLPPVFRPTSWLAKVPRVFTVVSQPLRFKPIRTVGLLKPLAKKPIADDLQRTWSRRFFADAGVRRDLYGFLANCDSKYTKQAAKELPQFDKPALIAWNPKNMIFPFKHAQRLADLLPDSRLELIQDARTFVSLDQPDRTASLIREFVREKVPA